MSVRGFAFVVLLGTLFAAVGSLFGLFGAAVALAFAVVLAFWSYWSSAAEIIARTGAELVRDPRITALTQELAGQAGIPTPHVYEFEDHQPNALALGPSPNDSIILITSGLRRQFPEDEIGAVLAHEIAHIANRDVFTGTLAAAAIAALLLLAIPLTLLGMVLRGKGGGGMMAIAVLAPAAALLVRCAMVRSVEYRADAYAARLCGDPAPLIAALSRLIQHTRPCEFALREPAFASMFFVDPLPSTWIGRLLASHPPIERRIDRLMRLTER